MPMRATTPALLLMEAKTPCHSLMNLALQKQSSHANKCMPAPLLVDPKAPLPLSAAPRLLDEQAIHANKGTPAPLLMQAKAPLSLLPKLCSSMNRLVMPMRASQLQCLGAKAPLLLFNEPCFSISRLVTPMRAG
jgi:hypothetical protein